jgi:NAD(P)H dehydrogenase (quinone)
MEKTVSVVYHSGYGHTQKQAEAIAAGAGEDTSTKVNLISVDDLKDPESASWTMLDESDALVFGSPTYMGSVSADLKAFMELSSGRWQEMKWVGKLAAGFTNSGSQNGDKQNSLIQILTCCSTRNVVDKFRANAWQ